MFYCGPCTEDIEEIEDTTSWETDDFIEQNKLTLFVKNDEFQIVQVTVFLYLS